MLSELYHLSKNIATGLGDAKLVHADFGEPGLTTNTNYRLILGPNGTILKIEPLDSQDFKGENRLALWTIKKGNFKFFPAVRIDQPLVALLPSDERWAALQKNSRETLTQILSEELSKNSIKFKGGEREQAERIVTKWRHADSNHLSLLQDFARSFLLLTSDPSHFAELLRSYLSKFLATCQNEKMSKELQPLICGSLKESNNKPPKVECKSQIIFDYQPEGEVAGQLYNLRLQRVVLECLNHEPPPAKKGKKKETNQVSLLCAFEPNSANAILSTPYPDWSAKPVIGKAFKIYSKFSDAACNFRYGKADTDGFPISEDLAKSIIGFASSITEPQHRGITWQGIRNGKFDTRNGKKVETFDLIIAYPTFPWKHLVPVSIFIRSAGNDDNDTNPDDTTDAPPQPNSAYQRAFRQVAETYIRALEKEIPSAERKNNQVRILLLRAISPGQVQLVYSASPNCNEFNSAVTHWLASENLLPEGIRIPLPSKIATEGFRFLRPQLLFPEEAVRVFMHQWKREGTDSHRIEAPSIGTLFDVFLRRDGLWGHSARELLETLLPRVEPLLIAAGQKLRLIHQSNIQEWSSFFSKDAQYSIASSVSLINTLLHTINRSNYMKETAYQFGRLLAAMDHLHKCYCVCERSGSYPPAFIGNGLLGRAADSPQDALAELCERGRLYLGWAETVQVKPLQNNLPEKAKKEVEQHNISVHSARKLLRICSEISPEIHASDKLNQPMDSAAKAHLLLGYLTKVLGDKSTDSETSTDSKS